MITASPFNSHSSLFRNTNGSTPTVSAACIASAAVLLCSCLDKHKDFCFDLFILDVVMPEPDGIQTGAKLRARGDNRHMAYLSACPFALSAYDVHAYSYLLKPIDRKKLFEILDNTHLSPRRPQARMFAIHVGSSVRMVSFDELISAELNSRTILYTLADGSVLQTPTIRSSFKTEVATLLTHEQFVQCSVSSVVNLRYVRCLEKNCLYLLDGRQIFHLPSGRRRRQEQMAEILELSV